MDHINVVCIDGFFHMVCIMFLPHAEVYFALARCFQGINLLEAEDKVQQRALKIIFPGVPYSDCLMKAGIRSLKDRRAELCKEFMRSLRRDNPLHQIASSRTTKPLHRYNLRADRNIVPALCNTNRLADFVTVKFVEFLQFMCGESIVVLKESSKHIEQAKASAKEYDKLKPKTKVHLDESQQLIRVKKLINEKQAKSDRENGMIYHQRLPELNRSITDEDEDEQKMKDAVHSLKTSAGIFDSLDGQSLGCKDIDAEVYFALARCFQGINLLEAEDKCGESIVVLRESSKHIEQAKAFAKEYDKLKPKTKVHLDESQQLIRVKKLINEKQAKSDRENGMIYHQRLPEECLPLYEPKCVVQPTAFHLPDSHDLTSVQSATDVDASGTDDS
ncbi:predicted protein [Nematostella vectensis]|uniref:BRO1 domain-containing protein n=1 Tax=Nematostella vectensis TaxID=45351 RepID=A7SWR0_NEMVE|nr:predicted protein [Nematostella vectensis]|eukprot:XP_001623940.1 predicted protein [Nematostella vectensis]